MPLNVGASIGSDAYATASTSNAYANAYSRQTTAPKQNGQQTSGGVKEPLRYPLKRIDNTSDYLEIKIFDYIPGGFNFTPLPDVNIASQTAQQRLKPKQSAPKCYILLPIPQNISDTVSVSWGDDQINALEAGGLALGAAAMKEGGAAFPAAVEFLKKNVTGAANNQKFIDAATNALSGKLVNALGGNVSITSLISRTTGQVMNNNLELLFKGVNLRSFQFTFDLAPRSQKEAEMVKLIIRKFKQEMTARNKASTEGTVGLFIESPSIFQLTYKSGGRKHPFLHTFKPCALTGCGVNYTASGTYATYQNKEPVHMQLSLEFKELNPIYSEDYDLPEAEIGVGY